jgi:hypothetical protein
LAHWIRTRMTSLFKVSAIFSCMFCSEMVLKAQKCTLVDISTIGPDGLAELLKPGEEPPMIIRSSTIITLNENLRYQVLMSNPVLQSQIISTERTKVIVVDISNSAEIQDDGEISVEDDATDPLSFSMLKEKKDGPQVIDSQVFQPAILTAPWPEHQLVPIPPADDDNECRVYVHVKDLARCGVFSSDWVLVSGGNHKRSRLCRIYGVDMDTYDSTRSNRYIPFLNTLSLVHCSVVPWI